MPRYNPDFSKVRAAELREEENEKLAWEHAPLQWEDDAELQERYNAEEEKVCRMFPLLARVLLEMITWRRLGVRWPVL